MKLTKMLTAVAVTSTVIAAMAMSASADFSAEYVAPTGDQTGKVALTDLSPATGDHTLLVLNRDVFGDFTDGEEGTVTVNAADIVQIDQAATFDTVVVGDLAAGIDAANQKLLDDYKALGENATKEQYEALCEAWVESVTYYVRVGGGTIDFDSFSVATTVTNDAEEPEDAPTYTLGDVRADGKIDINDVLDTLNACMGTLTLTDVQELSADVAPKGSPDGTIDINDVLLILNTCMGTATLQ